MPSRHPVALGNGVAFEVYVEFLYAKRCKGLKRNDEVQLQRKIRR